MSLINQVLQDLEKRHASEPELQSLPPHVRTVAGADSGFPVAKAVAAAVVVAGILVAAFYVGGWIRLPAPVMPSSVAEAPEPPAAVAPVAEVRPVMPEPAPAADEAEVALAPASRLSEELSFVPEARPRKAAPARVAKPAPARQQVTEPQAAPEPLRVADAPVPEVPAPPPAAAPVPEKPDVKEKESVPVPVAAPSPAPQPPVIDKQMREMTAHQRAEMAFRKGVAQLRDARATQAEASFRQALREDQTHVAARQALLGLLLDAHRNDEAEQLLRTTLTLNPRQPRHAMVLARLQVDRGDVPGGVNTLVGALPYVQSDPEYYAFLAALLQREGRHKETVDYYRVALRSSPGNALWLMGMGISLRATSQFAEARDSFERALETRQLTGELLAFTERQLRELGTAKK